MFGRKVDPFDAWLDRAIRVCLTETRGPEPSRQVVGSVRAAILQATENPSVLVRFAEPALVYPQIHACIARFNGLDNSGEPLVAALGNMGAPALTPLLQILDASPTGGGREGLDREFFDIMERDHARSLRGERTVYPITRLLRHQWPLFTWWICTCVFANCVRALDRARWEPWLNELWFLDFSSVAVKDVMNDNNLFAKQLVRDILRNLQGCNLAQISSRESDQHDRLSVAHQPAHSHARICREDWDDLCRLPVRNLPSPACA